MAERGCERIEVTFLLEAWSEGSIQAQLPGAVCNNVPFRKITEELCKAGYEHMYKQCRDKVEAQKTHYKCVSLTDCDRTVMAWNSTKS